MPGRATKSVAAAALMETFRKACWGLVWPSATVDRMGRFGLRLALVSLLLLGGLASALLAAGPPATTTTSAATTQTTQTTVASTARSVLVVTGHGFGHGLGMSQWGTYGYAKHGWTYDQILAHYYSGTTLGSTTVSTVRVLVAEGKSATLQSTAPWSVTDSAGTTVQLDTAPVALDPSLMVAGQQLVAPLAFKSAKPISVGAKPYRGRIVVSSDGKTIQVVDKVALESYVKGVVEPEMPASWPAEALKVQAVASRSYVLANLAHGGAFDVYGDSRSQDYGGVAAETPATNAAVDATKHQIVLYNGRVADTVYSTSSGGRTASAADTTGTPVPYLVSVDDPYDTAAPYHDWGPVLVDLTKVGKLLKLSAQITDVQTTLGSSERVKRVVVATADGAQVTLTGNQLRADLALRSSWFSVALLGLQKPKPLTYGGAASLAGFARGLDAVSLEAKPAGGIWAPYGDVVLDATGAFTTIVRPQVTTQYRLVSGNVRAGLASVGVAPRIGVQGSVAGAQGTMRPAFAGATVELQQRTGTTWATIATTATDAGGSWSFAQPLAPGSYRIRCTSAGHGLVPGLSSTLIL